MGQLHLPYEGDQGSLGSGVLSAYGLLVLGPV